MKSSTNESTSTIAVSTLQRLSTEDANIAVPSNTDRDAPLVQAICSLSNNQAKFEFVTKMYNDKLQREKEDRQWQKQLQMQQLKKQEEEVAWQKHLQMQRLKMEQEDRQLQRERNVAREERLQKIQEEEEKRKQELHEHKRAQLAFESHKAKLELEHSRLQLSSRKRSLTPKRDEPKRSKKETEFMGGRYNVSMAMLKRVMELHSESGEHPGMTLAAPHNREEVYRLVHEWAKCLPPKIDLRTVYDFDIKVVYGWQAGHKRAFQAGLFFFCYIPKEGPCLQGTAAETQLWAHVQIRPDLW